MAATKPKRAPFEIQGHSVVAGTRALINLPVGVFINHAQVDLTLTVIHGRLPGPTMLVTGCIHGDEINGTEIIRRLVKTGSMKRLRGTLLAVSIVNVPAFLNRSRYLPDRRDLNRLFPGSATGSLGSRLARVVTSELVPRCDLVIDLHTGAINRPNLPQIRVTTADSSALELARVFNAPVIVLAPQRPNTFRSLCYAEKKPIILYEAGEALRLDANSIRHGVEGILSVMRHIEMLSQRKTAARKKKIDPIVCEKSYWERAAIGGIFTPLLALGKSVTKDEVIGFVADPFGGNETPVTASREGVLIGRTNEGLADEGDGLFHIAVFSNLDQARDQIAASNQALPDTNDELDDHPVPYDPFMEEVEPTDPPEV